MLATIGRAPQVYRRSARHPLIGTFMAVAPL